MSDFGNPTPGRLDRVHVADDLQILAVGGGDLDVVLGGDTSRGEDVDPAGCDVGEPFRRTGIGAEFGESAHTLDVGLRSRASDDTDDQAVECGHVGHRGVAGRHDRDRAVREVRSRERDRLLAFVGHGETGHHGVELAGVQPGQQAGELPGYEFRLHSEFFGDPGSDLDVVSVELATVVEGDRPERTAGGDEEGVFGTLAAGRGIASAAGKEKCECGGAGNGEALVPGEDAHGDQLSDRRRGN